MTKKNCLFLFLIVICFVIAEFFYFPKKNEKFELINESIYKIKQKELAEKEANLINGYGFDDYINYDIEYSKVLFRDVYHFNEEITIYKGSKHNIKENYLVVNEYGLIGVVSDVERNKSRVQLLYNENTSLSVKVRDSYGILKSQNNELIIEGINNKADIKVGDSVFTSNISIHPEGVMIGTVKSISYDKYEIEQIITINPVVSFESISYVGIIMNLRGEE